MGELHDPDAELEVSFGEDALTGAVAARIQLGQVATVLPVPREVLDDVAGLDVLIYRRARSGLLDMVFRDEVGRSRWNDPYKVTCWRRWRWPDQLARPLHAWRAWRWRRRVGGHQAPWGSE